MSRKQTEHLTAMMSRLMMMNVVVQEVTVTMREFNEACATGDKPCAQRATDRLDVLRTILKEQHAEAMKPQRRPRATTPAVFPAVA